MGTDQRGERDLLCYLPCAIWGLYGIDGRDILSRFWRDGVERFIEVVFQVKVKCKGRHRENPVIDLFATILGFELF